MSENGIKWDKNEIKWDVILYELYLYISLIIMRFQRILTPIKPLLLYDGFNNLKTANYSIFCPFLPQKSTQKPSKKRAIFCVFFLMVPLWSPNGAVVVPIYDKILLEFTPIIHFFSPIMAFFASS